MSSVQSVLACVGVAVLLAACARDSKFSSSEETPPAEAISAEEAPVQVDIANQAQGIAPIVKPWTGDLDGMAERRFIRALVIHSKTAYFLDGAQQRGVSYDALKEYEKFLNDERGTGTLQVNIVFLPVQRDQLIPYLVEGRGDIALANLTVTPERLQSVDFTTAVLDNVSELLITGPSTTTISSWDDLGEQEIHVRKSSSYYESLQEVNKERKASGKPMLHIRAADEVLDEEDLLEMVNAGLIPATVVDSHLAEFWKQVFDGIVVHDNLTVRTGGEIAWAVRKGSPQLKESLDKFISTHRVGTAFGNILLRRYFKDTKWAKNPTTEAEMTKFRNTVDYFRKYGSEYDLDWLLVMAQSYQESRLDQNVRSAVGAVGVMQILPKTAAGPPISIPDIYQVENNVHAGVKYLRYVADKYFDDPAINRPNRALFAFASYNAGPNKIAKLRQEAAGQGLDPNKWFSNVELVAAKRIGRETVQYVSNIYKYYLAYQLILEKQKQRDAVAPKGSAAFQSK